MLDDAAARSCQLTQGGPVGSDDIEIACDPVLAFMV